MGCAPSATVYWGLNLGNMMDDNWDSLKPAWMEPEDEDDEGMYWDAAYAIALGWQPMPFPDGGPELSYFYGRHRGDYAKAEEEYKRAVVQFNARPDVKVWDEVQEAKKSLVNQSPVMMDTYGSMEDPCYYFCVKASVQTPPNWGDTELKPLVVYNNWEAQLMEFMRLLELIVPKDARPAWHVNCSYG